MAKQVGTIEFLKDELSGSRTGRGWLMPCFHGAARAGLGPRITSVYEGTSPWLCVMGIGDPRYAAARKLHRDKGRSVACWDMGYFGKSKNLLDCRCRVSLNSDHPTHEAIDATEPNPSRWISLGLRLYNTYDPNGHVVVVGMGPKSHDYIGEHDWEQNALEAAKRRFPNRRVVYRPKPRRDAMVPVVWDDVVGEGHITAVLDGASLVICRHSNVAIDACIMGVPVECEDGAAHWLYSRTSQPTEKQRLDLLHRLAWWQYRLWDADMEKGWRFLLEMERKLFNRKELAA